MKLPKMSVQECTVPIGHANCISSALEVEKIFMAQGLKYSNIKLMHIQTSCNEERICWCAMANKNDVSGYIPLFYEKVPLKGIPLTGKTVSPGEYISCNHGCYLLSQDDFYKQIVRRMTVFASYKQIFAAYAATLLQQNKTLGNECPDCELLRLSNVQTPNKTLCIAWLIHDRNCQTFFPVFEEDVPLLRGTNYNVLNWEYLDENDIFDHNNQRFVVCTDEENLPYIAKSHLQISKCGNN